MKITHFVGVAVLVAGFHGIDMRLQAEPPGKDLRLTYHSEVDKSDQPYRIYIPTAYDGKQRLPVIVAMHGTSGNEATLIEERNYLPGAIREAAEKRGVLLVSPLGRGTTEYRGIGENDVLCVLDDVQKRYQVDPDRIYLTGHSMGGTGAAYLALHHPDRFAAAAPLAAAYSFPWLARNAVMVPFLWIGGATDAGFYHRGVAIGVERMRKFGVQVLSEALPNEGHNGPVQDFDRVFAWLLQHKRNPHPRSYFFEIDTPLHGRAWWTSVETISQSGRMASIAAEAGSDNSVQFQTVNIGTFTFAPDALVFNTSQPVAVTIGGREVWRALIPTGKRLRLTEGSAGWKTAIEALVESPLTAYRDHPVAEAPEVVDMQGTEKRLANWITDAMRAATGADLALYNAIYYRGLPLGPGVVDIVDLIQCSRPFEQFLVTVQLAGRDVIAILDANADPQKNVRSTIDTPGSGRLVQLSGARYIFDPRRAAGERIVDTDLQLDRLYTVALEGQVVERETMLLAGRFEKLDYNTTNVPFTLALYGHAAKLGRIEAKTEGRVREATR
jgi:predicted esterase